MNPRVAQLWDSFALGLLRAAVLFRDMSNRSKMRECALEAVAVQRFVDPTVFRYQASLPLESRFSRKEAA